MVGTALLVTLNHIFVPLVPAAPVGPVGPVSLFTHDNVPEPSVVNTWSTLPLTLGNIDLAADTKDAVEEFEVTYRYQFFETNTTT